MTMVKAVLAAITAYFATPIVSEQLAIHTKLQPSTAVVFVICWVIAFVFGIFFIKF